MARVAATTIWRESNPNALTSTFTFLYFIMEDGGIKGTLTASEATHYMVTEDGGVKFQTTSASVVALLNSTTVAPLSLDAAL